MLKKTEQIIVISAMIMIAMTSSCKKSNPDFKGTTDGVTTVSIEQEKVIRFLEKFEQRKTDATKSEGDLIPIDDAVWYWDAAFNYQYGFPDRYIEQICYDTVCVRFPETDDSGNISESAMFETYSEIIEKSREYYMDIAINNKTLQ